MTTADDTLPELFSAVRALAHGDKVRLMQLLVVELAREEGIALLDMGGSYPIWSPYDAHDAAAVLLQVLGSEGTSP